MIMYIVPRCCMLHVATCVHHAIVKYEKVPVLSVTPLIMEIKEICLKSVYRPPKIVKFSSPKCLNIIELSTREKMEIL